MFQRRLLFIAIALFVLSLLATACSATIAGAGETGTLPQASLARRKPPARRFPLAPPASEAFLTGDVAPHSDGAAAAFCPVTTAPETPYQPPLPYPSRAPDPNRFWYGSDDLWIMLPNDGRWDQLLHGDKVFMWGKSFDVSNEPKPELGLNARRLDAPAVTAASPPPATNAYHDDFHWAMLTGLQVPTPGCWQVTAHYNDVTLTFVVWVNP